MHEKETKDCSPSVYDYVVEAKLVAIGTKRLHQLVASELKIEDPTEEEKNKAIQENIINKTDKVSPK